MRFFCFSCVFQKRIVLENLDDWYEILKFLDRKTLAKLEITCSTLNELICRNFAETPFHILHCVEISIKKDKLQFYDASRLKSIKLKNFDAELPAFLRFKKFAIDAHQEIVQNFIENSGLQRIQTALRDSHFEFSFGIKLLPTRQALSLYIHRHLLDIFKCCKAITIWGPIVPAFVTIREEPDIPILSVLFYEFHHVGISLWIYFESYTSNFREQWEQSQKIANNIPIEPAPAITSPFGLTVGLDEIFHWLHGERENEGKWEEEDGQKFCRTLSLAQDCVSSMFDQLLERLKNHFIHATRPLNFYKLEVVSLGSVRYSPSLQFVMHNAIGEQLSLETVNDVQMMSKHMMIIKRHAMPI